MVNYSQGFIIISNERIKYQECFRKFINFFFLVPRSYFDSTEHDIILLNQYISIPLKDVKSK